LADLGVARFLSSSGGHAASDHVGDVWITPAADPAQALCHELDDAHPPTPVTPFGLAGGLDRNAGEIGRLARPMGV
jgi:hypothetical protein